MPTSEKITPQQDTNPRKSEGRIYEDYTNNKLQIVDDFGKMQANLKALIEKKRSAEQEANKALPEDKDEEQTVEDTPEKSAKKEEEKIEVTPKEEPPKMITFADQKIEEESIKGFSESIKPEILKEEVLNSIQKVLLENNKKTKASLTAFTFRRGKNTYAIEAEMKISKKLLPAMSVSMEAGIFNKGGNIEIENPELSGVMIKKETRNFINEIFQKIIPQLKQSLEEKIRVEHPGAEIKFMNIINEKLEINYEIEKNSN